MLQDLLQSVANGSYWLSALMQHAVLPDAALCHAVLYHHQCTTILDLELVTKS